MVAGTQGRRARPREVRINEAQLIIAGRPRDGAGGATFDRLGPISGAVATRAAAGARADAAEAANAAAAAFPIWSTMPASARARVLGGAADLMAERADEVTGHAAAEIGSSPDWTRFNIDLAIAILRQAADLAPLLREQSQPAPADGERYILRRVPAGVILGIAPWNAAVTLATRAVAAPLACGNTVVLKGSELCPKTHEWVARALIDAGLPDGALNFVTNAPEQAGDVVEALIAHPAVRRINFTGSSRVGREIAAQAARHLKPCLLELSGKATSIVLADADLDQTAREVAHGAFCNQGQVCMSTERVLVDARVADAFVARLAAAADGLRAQGGRSPLGALIDGAAARRIGAMIEDALARGARLATGGEVAGGHVQPTVLDLVTPGMQVYAEEAFGPIAAITRFGDEEEAVSLANDTPFGLVASVFTADEARGLSMLREIDTGIGHVNRSTVFDDPRMPFGGLKASGYGRFGGLEALHEFTECQWLTTRPAGARHEKGRP
jgi:acyl-CoA reductase-like NAD-dependent aldehyde dehydrogenase